MDGRIKTIYVPKELRIGHSGYPPSWKVPSSPILYTTEIDTKHEQIGTDREILVEKPRITATRVELSSEQELIPSRYNIGLKNIDLTEGKIELEYLRRDKIESILLDIHDIIADRSDLTLPDTEDTLIYHPEVVPEEYVESCKSRKDDRILDFGERTVATFAETEPVQIKLDGVKLAKALLQHEKCGQYIVDHYLHYYSLSEYHPTCSNRAETIFNCGCPVYIPNIIKENDELKSLFIGKIEESDLFPNS